MMAFTTSPIAGFRQTGSGQLVGAQAVQLNSFGEDVCLWSSIELRLDVDRSAPLSVGDSRKYCGITAHALRSEAGNRSFQARQIIGAGTGTGGCTQ